MVACSAFALACAVPISSASQTATAVAAGDLPSSGGGSESSVRADNPSLNLSIDSSDSVDATLSPLATRPPLSAGTVSAADASLSADSVDSPTPSFTPTPKDTPTPTKTLAPGETPRPTPTITPTPTTPPQPSANLVNEALDLINNQRAARGLQPLTVNPALAGAATDYTKYMGVNNFFGHYAPDGSSPQSRLTAAGYKGHYRGEALSAGESTASQAIAALLASPAHAAILLDASANEVGIGYYYQPGSTYLYYWAVDTGAQ